MSDLWKFCVAPLMDGTDRHCRYFHRLLSKRARLYTEMITADAVIYGNREKLIGFHESEHPVALQIGGSDPEKLAMAAKIGADFGYGEINLNVGCPSDRVQSGAFGACLMKMPERVRDCIEAMRTAVPIPVTVKCRIGVDDQIPEESLFALVDLVAGVGCKTFIVHARKALLGGLSPKENRSVPPLNYGIVQRLKRERPKLTVVLNGGIESINQAQILSQGLDGVMLGRAAYGEPYILASVDGEFFGDTAAVPTREEVAMQMSEYLKQQLDLGVRAHSITRHMLGLYHGAPGARVWRRYISENAPSSRGDILDGALHAVRDAVRVDA